MTIDRTAGINNIKKMIDHFETLDKQELIQRLTLTKAQLLTAEKEIDRLNEYVQLMELEKGNLYGEKENKELAESYKESRRQTEERKSKEWIEGYNESIKKRTYKKLKDHATDISYENEKVKK
tara:strand:+ start:1341 stop:1709 length:369 start_codon:yes stop_codon:yes gene_type:complete